jgi:hypothetical protein
MSGSWFEAGVYVKPDRVAPVTVNVTLATVVRASFVFWTVHVPVLVVVHDAVPLVPLLQLPVTTTPLSAACAAFSIRTVTRAVQVLPDVVPLPSRSPTWNWLGGGAGLIVMDTVATLLVAEPSLAV